jgi:hypothetical protein
LDAVHFDLSPNLSPTRREALILTPLPLQGRGWGLGFSAVLHAIEKCYNTRPTDLEITGNVDTPDTPAMPAPDASVTLGDSASNPLTIFPLSEEEEATEYWQDTEDAERSTTASEGE